MYMYSRGDIGASFWSQGEIIVTNESGGQWWVHEPSQKHTSLSLHGQQRQRRRTCNWRVMLADRFTDQLFCRDAHNRRWVRILLAYFYSFGLLVGSDGKSLPSAGYQDTTHFDVHLTNYY